MAKPSITLRADTAPYPVTFDQLDQNFTNLRDATVSITAGTGGTEITTDLNGNITLVAGTNISLTGDNTAKTITINSTAAVDTFKTIAVSGQSNVVADSSTDTLTLVAGTGVNITTDAATDSITIEATGAAGSGNVASGIAGRIAYYPSTGATVDDLSTLEYDSGTNTLFSTSILKIVPSSSATPNITAVPSTLPTATPGSTKDFPNFSGLVIINNHSTGNVALWLCGGGTAVKISDTVSDTSGTIAGNGGITGYTWTNNTGTTFNVTFFSLKTRDAG